MASIRVEEFAFSALTLVDAGLAEAAFGVPNGAAGALEDDDFYSFDFLSQRRDALALAAAGFRIPGKVFLALLHVAGASALVTVPVVHVVVAHLGLADVLASLDVPSHDKTGGSVAIRSLENADASLTVEPVIWLL